MSFVLFGGRPGLTLFTAAAQRGSNPAIIRTETAYSQLGISWLSKEISGVNLVFPDRRFVDSKVQLVVAMFNDSVVVDSQEHQIGETHYPFEPGQESFMKSSAFSILLALCAFLSGCATMQTGGAFQAGRRALLVGDDEAALGFFQTVAESNPNFVFATGSSPRQSIWSFVGRAEYLTDRFPQARQSLERALSGDREENIARLYLGLTLIQEGDRQRGLKEIESGMRGIQSFLDNINQAQRFSIGQFWDPNRDIRSAIQYNLEKISSEGLNWQQLIASTERIALQMERETDLARRQESREMNRSRRRP
jgi:hypothetical protein